ncbi:MAG: lipase family protein [Leptolyngbya sp.]|nr:lipase family protein [Leptolyngbya sp.]
MSNLDLALQCARLSQEIYQDFARIRFPSSPAAKVTLIESQTEGVDTQAAILFEEANNRVFLAFRGSEDQTDWLNNFQFRQKTYPYGDESSTEIRFHRGFMAAYFAVRDRVTEVMKQYPQAAMVVTGHSLGGALATVAALDLQYNITQHTQQPLTVYTFGAPRVGNAALIASFEQRVLDSHRYVYGRDLVTEVPRWWQGYRHVPQQVNLGGGFTWNVFTRRLKDHDIQNYVDALKVIQGGAL